MSVLDKKYISLLEPVKRQSEIIFSSEIKFSASLLEIESEVLKKNFFYLLLALIASTNNSDQVSAQSINNLTVKVNEVKATIMPTMWARPQSSTRT